MKISKILEAVVMILNGVIMVVEEIEAEEGEVQ